MAVSMQNTKNQHYIPRFYMKWFADVKNVGTKKEKTLISFFQPDDSLCKDRVPTESVCSEKYFYDDDGRIERMLSDKEREWAKILIKINNCEDVTEDEINVLREFVVFQIIRTKAMCDHTQEMATTMLTKGLYNQSTNLEEDVIRGMVEDKVKVELTPEFNLELAQEILSSITDLELRIVDNRTDIAFITSDAPVIVVNPFGVHQAGLENIGIVIAFPVSRNKIVILYDSKLYGKINDNIVDHNCVDALNKYQYLSADERILAFSSNEFDKIRQDDKLKKLREIIMQDNKVATSHENKGTLIVARSRSMEYYFDITLFKLPRQLRRIPENFRETFPRQYNKETRIAILCRIYRGPDFYEDEDKKKWWSECQKYAKKILNYLDYYWETPSEDCSISADLMHKLKTVPVNTHLLEK